MASLLFPRELRPHLRAVYGFARLVDILGDEAEGDRLAALDELERELAACYSGEPSWPVIRALAPTIRAYGLPREPFLRLIDANRQDQRVSAYETWDDLRGYCRLSAEPVGRLVLGLLRRDSVPELVAASDDVCTGLQLVNFLQDVPRDLALGRIYLPAEDRRRFGVTELALANEPFRRLLAFEAERARDLLAAGELLRRRLGGRIGAAVGLFARGGLAALEALASADFDVFTRRPRPSRARLARATFGSTFSPRVAQRKPRDSLTADRAYAEVSRITRRRARNFAYGIMVLPRPKRRATAAIYAFARLVDDIADGDLPAAEKRSRLERLHGALDAPPTDEAMWVALADARGRYPIPAAALHDLVDGGLQDLDQQRFADFDELAGYCRRVAGAVGIACTAVYGVDEPKRAQTLGIALQLINIMRDVPEDWSLGRVYLPQDELASFGVGEEDIAAGRCTTAWRSLMAHQAARARAYLADGLTLVERLDARSAACVSTFAGLYRATLDRIEDAGFDVFSGPPPLSPYRKLRTVGASVGLAFLGRRWPRRRARGAQASTAGTDKRRARCILPPAASGGSEAGPGPAGGDADQERER